MDRGPNIEVAKLISDMTPKQLESLGHHLVHNLDMMRFVAAKDDSEEASQVMEAALSNYSKMMNKSLGGSL